MDDLLFLGDHPLANAIKQTRTQTEKTYPLTLTFCRTCGLVQIKETVDKSLLFSHYVWVTGTSSAATNFSDKFFRRIEQMSILGSQDFVLEIASNDGTFLKPFKTGGYKVIGVDPAANIAEIANRDGIETINAFWNPQTAEKLVVEHGKPSFIFARNVIAHVSDLHGVVSGIQTCLDIDGVGAVEFHYADNILKGLQYDSIYHEHLCYYSVGSVSRLLKMYGLYPFHVESSPISGGAMIVFFSKTDRKSTFALQAITRKESEGGLNSLSAWTEFAGRCRRHKRKSQELLSPFTKANIVGFGASARSSTYLNFCGFKASDIRMIIDNNPIKQGFYSPGSTIPIVSMEQGLRSQPDLIFILAWNFKDELISLCRSNGYTGRFFVPFPNEPYLI